MLPARLIPGMESSVVRMASHALGRGCAVVNGSLLCWKSDNANYKYTSAPPATALNHVGSSSYVGSHFNNECSIRYGAVYCWGNLLVGKQNDQTAERHDGRIRDLTAVSAVAARLGGACALMKGAVYCWGSNDYGELGLGTTTAKTYEPIPRLVPTMASGVTAIASNGYTVCAIKAGDLYCWGVRQDGQMVSDVVEYKRNVAVTTPTLIGGLGAGVKSVAIGSSNTCVVTASGGVMCWGDNIYGQLGNGNETDSATPVAVIGISGVL